MDVYASHTGESKESFACSGAHRLNEKFWFQLAVRPYFCQNFCDGNQKKKQRIVLDLVFCVGCAYHFCHCHALALADVAPSFCVYFFCIGTGYCLISDL